MTTFPNMWLRRLYSAASQQAAREISAAALEESALVFSPHQDDETLGCGGTILRKKAVGAQVRIIYMTDGRTSHSYFMPEEELVVLREKEALAACLRLGLKEDEVAFLNFRDGQLNEFHKEAILRVEELLLLHKPAAVFIPYYREPTLDHQATNAIVLAALEKAGLPVMVYEYPVWFWYHWPWVRLIQDKRRQTLDVARNTLKTGFGMRLIQDFRRSVLIKDVLNDKRAALEEHRSQMTQRLLDCNWPTLGGISKGDWLACFFQERELFYSYLFDGRRRSYP